MEITVADLYDFKVCPLRFKFMKIDKVCNELTTNDGIREALQSVINYYYFHLQQGQQLPLSALKEKFSRIWHGSLDLYDIYIPDKRNKRKKELEAIGMLNNFYMKQRNEPDLVIASNLDFRIPFGTNFFVKGNIPAIRETSAGIEIVVYKMGKHKYDEFWQKTDMGLTLMAMAYESMFKQEVDSIAVHVLSSGQVHHIHRKKEDYKRLVKTIRMVRESIEKKWLYPRETYACEKCPARDLCMEWR
ncbi:MULTISPECIES: PD-(D/E)XK nuclease family protein [Bacillus subtilis group]|uniref:PD-(D/E)XK nuclease family protein n=1 Tax=Bacillus subtilis group TaxID=653685 RepID=UPI001B2DB40A|nr:MULTISPECIES: PD-(D/E)XK nuclease family protein [Bacillus subtilis group]MED4338011.1 PD-(D/E)XK nuclease family protein [Bacillus licheniformis]MED4370985.1 PD-(D/E)XK nuclease family protein [Bacillus licheniformis]GIN55117.1 hypothetical protein J36TS2_40110 [Bacillus paralicheniformis]